MASQASSFGRFIVCGIVWVTAWTATFALEGRVVDERTGNPIANVELSVVGRTQTGRSDADGRFVLVPDPRPPFEVIAILPGGRYANPVLVESLPTDGPWIVAVTQAGADSVTVTAGAASGIVAAPTSARTTVSRSDIRSRQSRNLTQALENVPGVSNVWEGHAAVPAIRGLAQARSLLLIDGHRVTSERRVGPSATYLDPVVLESVEVSRGPGSVAYGSDALGGVIMARTRRPIPGAGFEFDLAASYGAGIPQERIAFDVETGIGERAGFLFAANYRDFGDYDSPEGTVPNSSSTDYGLLASYTQLVSHGVFLVTLMGNEGQDIERPRTNSEDVRFYYPEETSFRLTTSYESGAVRGLDSTNLSLFLGDYAIVTDQDRYATDTTNRQIERADVSAHDFGLRATAEDHWGQARLDFGIDINGRFGLAAEDVTIDFDAMGGRSQVDTFETIEDAQRIDYGAYATVEGAVASAVSLSAGLRYDFIRSTNSGGYFGDMSVDNSEPTGYVAVTLGGFAGFSTALQYTHGFRDARLSDRFFRGVTGAGFITGNPDLEPETSRQYDLALRYTARRWHPAVYLYHYTIHDLIERYEDPMQPDFFYFRNRGEALIRGAELEVTADLPQRIALLIAASVSDGESPDDGSAVDDITPERFVVQARKGLGSGGWVQLRVAWTGALDDPGPTEVPRDAFTLVDVGGGWRVTDGLELQLFVRNLLDESYLLTPDRRSPLAPGVSATLSVRYVLEQHGS